MRDQFKSQPDHHVLVLHVEFIASFLEYNLIFKFSKCKNSTISLWPSDIDCIT